MTIAAYVDFHSLLSACGAPGSEVVDGKTVAVFAEPWHAEVVATTLNLSQNGLFTWSEWVDHFSRQIALRPQTELEDANTAYYRQWFAALEAVLYGKQILKLEQVCETQEDWKRSYLNTKHGMPVRFQRGLALAAGDFRVQGHDDEHHHPEFQHSPPPPGPVSVSPAAER